MFARRLPISSLRAARTTPKTFQTLKLTRSARALYSTTPPLSPTPSPNNDSASSDTTIRLKQPLEPRLSMTFTCTVPDCGTRSTHEFTKRSYEKGIVIVQCPGCENRHLIADNLGWFKDDTKEGRMRTVEDFMRAKGEKVRRGKLHNDGDIEYVED